MIWLAVIVIFVWVVRMRGRETGKLLAAQYTFVPHCSLKIIHTRQRLKTTFRKIAIVRMVRTEIRYVRLAPSLSIYQQAINIPFVYNRTEIQICTPSVQIRSKSQKKHTAHIAIFPRPAPTSLPFLPPPLSPHPTYLNTSLLFRKRDHGK